MFKDTNFIHGKKVMYLTALNLIEHNFINSITLLLKQIRMILFFFNYC